MTRVPHLLVFGLGYKNGTDGVLYTGGLDEVVTNLYKNVPYQSTIFVRSTLPQTAPTILLKPFEQVQVNAIPVKSGRGGEESRKAFRVAVHHTDITTALDFVYTALNGYIRPMLHLLDKKNIIVHCHDWLTAKMIPLLKSELGAPSIFSVHLSANRPLENYIRFLRIVEEHGIADPYVRERYHAIDRRLLLEAEGCEEADIVHCVSKATAESVMQAYNIPRSKIRVIYNGVDTDVFSPLADSEQIQAKQILQKYNLKNPFIISTGRFVMEKGHKELVEAFKVFGKNHPDYTLAIFGFGGETYGELLALRSSLPGEIQNRVVISSRDIREDVPYLYKAADIAAFPSHTEAFGIVAVEAMSCGKPVIVGDTGGLKEIIADENNGKLGIRVNGRDPQAIAEGLEKAFENKDKWGNLAREHVQKNFSWKAIAEQYTELYKELISKR